MTAREEKVASIVKSLKNYIRHDAGMFTTIVPKALLGDAMRELESHAAQSQEVIQDAARFNHILSNVCGMREFDGKQKFIVPKIEVPVGVNIMQGSVAGHFRDAITKLIEGAGK